MTERSSCKSFFGNYLIYRIKAQQMNLILCCIMNALALPLFVISQIKGFSKVPPDSYYIGRIMSVISGVTLIILAVFGAVTSFEYYNKKNLTDTVGSLPLSYKQRFWGDFLAGYIANVAPVIPCGLISAAIFAGAQSKFKTFCIEKDFSGTVFSTFRLALCMAFSLFIALTFLYLFAVLISTACGRFSHSVMFSIFGIFALCGAAAGIAGCFAVGMLGANTGEYMKGAASFVPPLGSLIDLSKGFRFLGGNFEIFRGKPLTDVGIGDIFAAANVLNIVYFVILGVGIIFGAFYLGKRRKPEKTGSTFVVKPAFYVISSLMSAAAVFLILVNLVDSNGGYGKRYVTAAIAGVIMCVVSLVTYLPKLRELPRCILCGFAVIGASVGLAALFNATGSFGLAYLPSAEEIEYLKINDSYTVTDKEDIKKYIEKHNEILRDKRNYLIHGYYSLEYKTTDGNITKLAYSGSLMSVGDPIRQMEKNEERLNGYGKYFFESFADGFDDWSCVVLDENSIYDIPEQNKAEFIAVLREEAGEKYDPDAEVYARVEFRRINQGTRSFYIGKNLERTIAFLNEMNGTIEKDPNKLILEIRYFMNEHNFGVDFRVLEVRVRNKDMDKALVKELIGLLGKGDDFSGNINGFEVIYRNYSDSSAGYYYIPRANSKRVLEIMTELALDEFE